MLINNWTLEKGNIGRNIYKQVTEHKVWKQIKDGDQKM